MSNYPNTFYRVSVKAFIKNTEGHVLVLKENQATWSLPGGGLDHGEEPALGLKRELEEELGITRTTAIEPLCIKTFYLEPKQAWLMWVVYAVQTPLRMFTLGAGVTEAKFITSSELRGSTDIFEKMVHEVSHHAREQLQAESTKL